MTVFDDGSGDELFVGGNFSLLNGVPAGGIAKWNGTAWTMLGSGVDVAVRALTVFDDGNGAALYAGGTFATAGGVTAYKIAKWDGTAWSPLGSGLNTVVFSLSSFDDGYGSALYAGGIFQPTPGEPYTFLAKWGCPLALSIDVAELSLGTGGQQNFSLDGGAARAGWFYFLLGSVTGTKPGIDFGGGVVLPLNLDPYLRLTLFHPKIPAFSHYRGTLDDAGQAQASLSVNPINDPTLYGVVIHHAFVAASVFGVTEYASNPVPVSLIP